MQCLIPDCSKKVLAKNLCQAHYDRKRRYGDFYTRPDFLQCQSCKAEFKVYKQGNLPKYCQSCSIDHHRTKQRNDRRRKGLWENYKITLVEYEILYKKQKGLCKICKEKTTGRGAVKNTLAVDHDHKTGKIRGLLCIHCNTGLGLFRDNQSLLNEAINYLKENEDGNV